MRPRSLPFLARLDRYVARLFALSYCAAFFLVVGLFVIIDMATHLDEYLSPDKSGVAPPTLMVARFYLLQLPFLYLQMSPYVTLVAGLFTGARLARNNEVVAALNAGVSARRLLLPVYLGAALLAGGMFVLREQATARIGRARDLLQDHLEERRPFPTLEKLVVRDLRGHDQITIGEFDVRADPYESEARVLSAHHREGDVSTWITARAAHPLSGGRWRLEGGQRLQDDGRARTQELADVLDELRFSPQDVELAWKAREHPLDLSHGELVELLARDPTNLQYQTLLQSNLTFPLAGLVLLLVGIPFVVADERGKRGERVARGFLLCVVYFGVDFVARTLGLQGVVGPLFAAWLPLVLFGSLGAALTVGMRT